MAGLYGHRWTSAYGDDPRSVGGKEWALTLAGFTRQQIDTGLNACRNSVDEWPPSATGFKARCLGIPSLNTVRLRMTDRTDPFVRLVWEFIDAYAMSRASQHEADRMVQRAYEAAAEARMGGAEFPEPVAEIEHQEKPFKRADPDHVARCMAEALGGGE